MNTLIKPPCFNKGQGKQLVNTQVVEAGRFEILIEQYECSFRKMTGSYGKPALRDNYSCVTYTIDEIYFMCKALNHNTNLTKDEWNTFIYDIIQLAHNDKALFEQLFSIGIEQGIKAFVCWTDIRIRREIEILVNTYATPLEAYNNEDILTRVCKNINSKILRKPFSSKHNILKIECQKYKLYEPFEDEKDRYTMGTMK